MRKNTIKRIAIFLLLALIFLYFISLWINNYGTPISKVYNTITSKNSNPVILIYKDFYGSVILSDFTYNISCCYGGSCNIIRDSKIHDFDAVIVELMHFMEFYNEYKQSKIKGRKMLILIFYEPQTLLHYLPDIGYFEAYFDIFLWSYLTDSTFYSPFGEFETSSSFENNTDFIFQEFKRRKGGSVSIISNCMTLNTNRIEYTNQLSKHFPVIKGGGCFNNPIDDKYFANITKNNKFYLSFENSLCGDYISEKLWNPLVLGLIPVVYGGSNYRNFLPEHSYINVMDFDSPKALAHYLNQVSKNYSEYEKYHKWKFHYKAKLNLVAHKYKFACLIGCKVKEWTLKNYVNDLALFKIKNRRYCHKNFVKLN